MPWLMGPLGPLLAVRTFGDRWKSGVACALSDLAGQLRLCA